MMTTTANPATLYMANLSEGSQGMRQVLDVIAGILDPEHDAESFPWHQVTYSESMAVRMALVQRYKPATVNKMLSALRGVLKQTWRLGLIDSDSYHRAAAVENVRCSNLLSGRALETEEIAKLFETCAADQTPMGARDAAILAVFYGCGLRRGELAKLDVDDVDFEDGSIMVPLDMGGLANQIGLSVDEVESVLRRLDRLSIVEQRSSGFRIPDVMRLHEFLEFLQMREKFGDV